MPKTYAREVACAIMAFDLGLWLMVALGHAEAAQPADALLPYSFALLLGAFGMRSYVAQILPQKLGK